MKKLLSGALSLFALVLAATIETASSQTANATSTVLETLTMDQAKKALERVGSMERQPGLGTWRKIEFTEGETNILYQWKSSEKLVLRRKEVVTPSPTNSSQIDRRVHLDNPEGSWSLVGNYAYSRDWPLEEKSDLEGWPGDKASGETLMNAMLMNLKDAQLARAATVTGQRIERDGAAQLHLVEVYDDKAQKRVIELMAAPIKQIKKQIPLLLRPFVTTSLLTEGLTQDLPRRKELFIDDSTGDVVERRLYQADGTFLGGEVFWAKCPDLAMSDYAIPAGMKRMGVPVIANDISVGTNKSGITMEEPHSITLKGDDVLLASVPSGPTALLQFTEMGTNAAAYRWRCRPNKVSSFETGTGTVTRAVITVNDAAGKPTREWHPGNDTTIRAGLIWLKWKPAKDGGSEILYQPKKIKVKKLGKEAFDKDPQ